MIVKINFTFELKKSQTPPKKKKLAQPPQQKQAISIANFILNHGLK